MAPIPRAVGLGRMISIGAASTKIGLDFCKSVVDYHLNKNNSMNYQIMI